MRDIGTFYGATLYLDTNDQEVADAAADALQRAISRKRTAYAWFGFCTIVVLVLGLVAFLVWANIFINANL